MVPSLSMRIVLLYSFFGFSLAEANPKSNLCVYNMAKLETVLSCLDPKHSRNCEANTRAVIMQGSVHVPAPVPYEEINFDNRPLIKEGFSLYGPAGVFAGVTGASYMVDLYLVARLGLIVGGSMGWTAWALAHYVPGMFVSKYCKNVDLDELNTSWRRILCDKNKLKYSYGEFFRRPWAERKEIISRGSTESENVCAVFGALAETWIDPLFKVEVACVPGNKKGALTVGSLNDRYVFLTTQFSGQYLDMVRRYKNEMEQGGPDWEIKSRINLLTSKFQKQRLVNRNIFGYPIPYWPYQEVVTDTREVDAETVEDAALWQVRGLLKVKARECERKVK